MNPENGRTPVAFYKPHNEKAFCVDWHICKRCNFDCSYCGESHDDLSSLSEEFLHDMFSKHIPLEKMILAVDTIRNMYGHDISWSITGGEPTIIPWLPDVLRHIYEEPPGAFHVSICTNGSRTKQYLIDIFQYMHSITMSLHFEFMAHREDEYIDKIIEIENWRKYWNKHNPPEDHKWFGARFMAEPGEFHLIERMNKAFVDAGVEKIETRSIRPVWKDQPSAQEFKTLKVQNKIRIEDIQPISHKRTPKIVQEIQKREQEWYTAEEHKKLLETYNPDDENECKKLQTIIYDDLSESYHHYNQLNYEFKNNFEGWKCYTGISQVKIAPNGDLYIAGCHVGGKLGNIYNDPEGWSANQALRKEPVICPQWRCTDNMALGVPKVKPGYEHLVLPYVATPIRQNQ